MHRILPVGSFFTLFYLAALHPWQGGVWSQAAEAEYAASTQLRLDVDSLPSPPKQAAAWEPPETRSPKEFVSATAKLFHQGLADPRGCEYREIEVVVGSFQPPWSDAIIKTHGWVLPDDGNAGQRFGICWNGLVYPLVSLGKPADVRADAALAAKEEVAECLFGTGRYWKAYFEDRWFCHPWEGRAVFHASPLPIKASLLLRLGEAKLAEELWDHWTAGLAAYSMKDGGDAFSGGKEDVEASEPNLKSPYLALANCWTLSLFDRAVACHLRGDDRLALASVETLMDAWPAIEAEAAKCGFLRPAAQVIGADLPRLLLDGGRAKQFLADQRQRAEDRKQGEAIPILTHLYANPSDPYRVYLASDNPKFIHALHQQVARCPDKSHRIVSLIRQLKEHSTGPLVVYGAANNQDAARLVGGQDWDRVIMTDRSAQAIPVLLGMEGEDAVEPLLVCLERDNRLTRMPSGEEPYPAPVCTIAKRTLEEILAMPFAGPEIDEGNANCDSPERRRAAADQIRAYWSRYKGVAPAERWYRILADDDAEPNQWFSAVRAILQPASVPVTLNTLVFGWDDGWRRDTDQRQLHGDVLRNKANPSVSDLMAKRIESLREAELSQEPGGTTTLRSSRDMALCLARWDRKAAIPHLQSLAAMCQDAGRPSQTGTRADCIVPLFLARAEAGDLAALDEYSLWVRNVRPEDLSRSHAIARLFEPLCRFPEHPAVAETAQWLFNDRGSAWYSAIFREEWRKDISMEAVSSPLVALPAFRSRLLEMLDDRQTVGQVTVVSNEEILLGLNRGERASTVPDDPLCPQAGAKAAFRMCDGCAYTLSKLPGMPKCELYWPEKDRDQAVEACASMLRQYGYRFRVIGNSAEDSVPLRSILADSVMRSLPLYLQLPPLDHPATPADVQKGNAIFSLGDQKNARNCAMPKLPRKARWAMLKDYPVLQYRQGEDGKTIRAVGYEQEGTVWQAEEVRVDGRWLRYYGIVGPHGLAKVPAEEIEFSQEMVDSIVDSIKVGNHLFVGLDAAPGANKIGCVKRSGDADYYPALWAYCPNQPMVFAIRASNTSGTDQPQPLLAEDALAATGGAIPVALELRYSSALPALECWYGTPGFESAKIYSEASIPWTPLPRKTEQPLHGAMIGKDLAPTERRTCLELDLNRLFDVSRPGIYRLAFRLKCGTNGVWRESEIFFAVIQK